MMPPNEWPSFVISKAAWPFSARPGTPAAFRNPALESLERNAAARDQSFSASLDDAEVIVLVGEPLVRSASGCEPMADPGFRRVILQRGGSDRDLSYLGVCHAFSSSTRSGRAQAGRGQQGSKQDQRACKRTLSAPEMGRNRLLFIPVVRFRATT